MDTFFSSFIANMSFWVDLHKDFTQTWVWGNQDILNVTDIASLPLKTDFENLFNSSWTCAVWNMAEPFLKQVPCSSSANIMCTVPSSPTSKQLVPGLHLFCVMRVRRSVLARVCIFTYVWELVCACMCRICLFEAPLCVITHLQRMQNVSKLYSHTRTHYFLYYL